MKLAGVETKMSNSKAQAEVKKMLAGEQSKGATIRAMFAGGWEVKEIADFTGIRYNHVYNVVKNEVIVHGLETVATGRAAGNTKKAKILELLQAGKTITEVSQEMKCLYNQVWQIAKANGYTNKQKAAAVTTVITTQETH